MLDGVMRKLIDPPLNDAGRGLATLGITANQLTLTGLALGFAAAILVASGNFWWALVLILLSRLADGLDGAVARATQKTAFGGYLDIAADFFFYGAVPFGFVVVDPAANALAGAFLLFSFYFNGTTFLGYAVLAEKFGLRSEKRGAKTLYYAAGLLEGTETIVFLVALCLWPHAFAPLAWVFGLLCFLTGGARLATAWLSFHGQAGRGLDLVEPVSEIGD